MARNIQFGTLLTVSHTLSSTSRATLQAHLDIMSGQKVKSSVNTNGTQIVRIAIKPNLRIEKIATVAKIAINHSCSNSCAFLGSESIARISSSEVSSAGVLPSKFCRCKHGLSVVYFQAFNSTIAKWMLCCASRTQSLIRCSSLSRHTCKCHRQEERSW